MLQRLLLSFVLVVQVYAIDNILDQSIDTEVVLTDKLQMQKSLERQKLLLRNSIFLQDQLETTFFFGQTTIATSAIETSVTVLDKDKNYSKFSPSYSLKWKVATSQSFQNGFYLDYSSPDFTTNNENGSSFHQLDKTLMTIGTDVTFLLTDWMNLTAAFEMKQDHVIDLDLESPESDSLINFKVTTTPTIKLGSDFRIINLDNSVFDLSLAGFFGMAKTIGTYEKDATFGLKLGAKYSYILTRYTLLNLSLDYEQKAVNVANSDSSFSAHVAISHLDFGLGLVFIL